MSNSPPFRLNRFPIPAIDEGTFATGCNCGGSTHDRLVCRAIDGLELVGLRAALKSGDPELASQAIQRLTLIAAERRIRALEDGETAAGSWFDLEEGLGNLIATTFKRLADKIVLPLLDAYFVVKDVFDAAGFAHAVQQADDELTKALDDQLEPKVRDLITQTITAGEEDVASGLIQGMQSVKDVVEALTSSTMGYTDDFFTNYVVPAVQREIDTTLAEGPLAIPNLALIQDTLKERLAADSYHSLVANATVSRAYHYGFLKAAQQQGYETIVFSAVIDEKTSAICRWMNGKSWTVAAALDKYDRSVRAQTTDELKAIAPWFARDASLSMDADAKRFIATAGVPTPPLHGFCRSTLLVM